MFIACLFATAFLLLIPGGLFGQPIEVGPDDWPWWRGKQRNGVASPAQDPPLEWSEAKNIVWQAKVPGRGHGSPTVVGDRVLVATADEQRGTQSVLCFDRHSGQRLWQTVVFSGGLMQKNQKASAASSTVACDGHRAFINFANGGAVYTVALGLDGEQIWKRKISDYVVHQGYGSSPAIYGSLVIVSADNKSGGAVAAFRRRTGELVWRRQRPATPNYPSPIVLSVAGREQLLLTGCDRVTSLNPSTGETLWEIEGATTECVTSTVTDGQRIFTSGGYPQNHLSAVRADGSGAVEWKHGDRIYVPSMIVRDHVLFAVLDAGIAACWKTDTGEELWKQRLGGTFSSSLVLVGDRLYATNESGTTYVFRADPKRFELLGKSRLGDVVYATPAICGGQLFHRFAKFEGEVRQEYLVCIGQ